MAASRSAERAAARRQKHPRKVPAATDSPAEAPPPPKPRPQRDRTLVALAEVARPHGIAGELRLKVYNLESDLLLKRPPVLLRLPEKPARPVVITMARAVDKALLVRLEGVDDRNAAEELRGAEICVPRSALPPPEEGEFYVWDLEGAQAVLASGEAVGEVTEMVSYPTCDVLVVLRPDGKRLEVPMQATYVERVDAARGVVTLVTVDGLD
jgi:16S rRNA processing protein RimM